MSLACCPCIKMFGVKTSGAYGFYSDSMRQGFVQSGKKVLHFLASQPCCFASVTHVSINTLELILLCLVCGCATFFVSHWVSCI